MTRRSRPALAVLLLLLVALTACGGAPMTATPSVNVGPTQTRAAELAQLATLTAPTATALPSTAAVGPTQTRVAELAQIATLSAPTAPPRDLPTAGSAGGALTNGSFVGRVAGSDAFVAIVANGADVMAYVCDGKNLAQWFKGQRQGSAIELTTEDGARLTVNMTSSAGTGSLRQASGTFRAANGEERRFDTAATTTLDRAGLYRGAGVVDGGNAVLGVIVLPSGEFRGAFWVSERVTPVDAPVFGANSLTAVYGGSVTVSAQRLGVP